MFRLNERDEFYTTRSCAGRCFLYQGKGVKRRYATSRNEVFERCRISHELVKDPQRYFDLTTLATDRTGGADPIRSVGQFDHAEQVKELEGDSNDERKVEKQTPS